MGLLVPDQGLTWKPILELRARFERRTDRDFSNEKDDNTSDLLSRVRVGASFTKGRLSGRIVYQYAHGEEWAQPANFSAWRSDVLLGYVQAKVGPGSLIVGRQRLSFGSERLLGAADWNNASNAWDAVRFSAPQYDLFAAKLGVSGAPNAQASLYGGAYTQGPYQTLLVYRHDHRSDRIDEATLSQAYRANVGRFRIDAEVAGQIGERDGLHKLAGAADVIASLTVAPKLTFSAQASVATGGKDGDTTHTFDQLYPAIHDKHGLIDAAGWKNIRDLGLWFRYEPDKLTSLKLQYHRLALQSKTDAWYAANGRPNAGPNGPYLDPTGRSGRDLGNEFDFDFSRKLNLHQTLRAGIGVLRPGDFVRAFNGGSTKDQVWGYVQWGYAF